MSPVYETLHLSQDSAHPPEQQTALHALLRAVQLELDAVVNDFIARFYDELLSQPRFSRVLGLLSSCGA
jgi:hypothetical protein